MTDARTLLLQTPGLTEERLDQVMDVGFRVAFRTQMSKLYECQGCYCTTTIREDHFMACDKVQAKTLMGLFAK